MVGGQQYKMFFLKNFIDLTQKKLEMYNQSLNFITNTSIYKLLTGNNYKLINWVQSDLIFVRKDYAK